MFECKKYIVNNQFFLRPLYLGRSVPQNCSDNFLFWYSKICSISVPLARRVLCSREYYILSNVFLNRSLQYSMLFKYLFLQISP
jgi:hypothetical protein